MSEEIKTEEKIAIKTEEKTEEQKKAEELRKTVRALQILQYPDGKIEIIPIQNIHYGTDIIGILTQCMNNMQQDTIMRNQAALLKEAVKMIKNNKDSEDEVEK